MIPTDNEMEQFIRERFLVNFEQLSYESGHGLAPDVKLTALQQILFYWRRLRDVAMTITDTEVKLNLPSQHTPRGREFGIEGVVDIVREYDHTVMYDIKTHDVETVHVNIEEYERQLNIYAHIWQNLHGEELDETAIIATQFSDIVRQAWESGNPDELSEAIMQWNPIVPIPFEPQHVDETIKAFGRTVDDIEDGCFSPPSSKHLGEIISHNQTFATRTCRNCDARFSCSSFRKYAAEGGVRDSTSMRRYYEDYGEEEDRESWRDAALNSTFSPEE